MRSSAGPGLRTIPRSLARGETSLPAGRSPLGQFARALRERRGPSAELPSWKNRSMASTMATGNLPRGLPMLYHLVVESEWRGGQADGRYAPARFAEDGFVHCAGNPQTTLEVAASYFSGVQGRLLAVQLDPARIDVEVRWEDPAPISGGGTGHLREGRTFPHVYGTIPLAAVVRVVELVRVGGRWAWP